MAGKPKNSPDDVMSIKPNTPEMAAYLAGGYGITLEKARTIIKERESNPQLWPYEQFERAQAMVEAYSARPEAVSTREPWSRTVLR
jgi:hypothetical protein